MARALILADDLTGAADSGAQFARQGWRTLLALEPRLGEMPEVLVLSSETRALPAGHLAAGALTQALADLSAAAPLAGFPLVYKKIDSTLRGHPAAELKAALSALDEQRALIAPAFPAQGRITLDGRVFVHGAPLEEAPFAAEEGGDLRRIFGPVVGVIPLATVRAGGAALRTALSEGATLLIADAVEDADLRALAQAGLETGLRVFCGSAGLAGALASMLGTGHPPAQPPLPSNRPALAVVGSLQAASAAQVSAAQRAGAVLIHPPLGCFCAPEPSGMAETAARLAAALRAGRAAILATRSLAEVKARQESLYLHHGYAQENEALSPAEICARLARIAALAMNEFRPGGLFLTGGDTARAVCSALGCARLWLGGEVEPGIPWSRLADGPFAGLTTVTKAGGFGSPDALHKAIRFLGPG